MKKIIVVVVVLLLLTLVGFFIVPKVISHPKPVHFHAGFQVYLNDKLQNFSDWKYMHEAPCTVDGKPVDEHEDEQIEKAHLHDQVGDVVHVHRVGATWKDLFTNLKFPLDPKNLTAYVNSKRVNDILTTDIKPYDSVVIFVGKHSDDGKYLKAAVTTDHIKTIEKRSETCGSGS